MRVVLTNNNRMANQMRVALTNNNKIARVNFSKIAKVPAIGLKNLYDVSISGQKNGDVLVYESNTSNYKIETLTGVDGGTF